MVNKCSWFSRHLYLLKQYIIFKRLRFILRVLRYPANNSIGVNVEFILVSTYESDICNFQCLSAEYLVSTLFISNADNIFAGNIYEHNIYDSIITSVNKCLKKKVNNYYIYIELIKKIIYLVSLNYILSSHICCYYVLL